MSNNAADTSVETDVKQRLEKSEKSFKKPNCQTRPSVIHASVICKVFYPSGDVVNDFSNEPQHLTEKFRNLGCLMNRLLSLMLKGAKNLDRSQKLVEVYNQKQQK